VESDPEPDGTIQGVPMNDPASSGTPVSSGSRTPLVMLALATLGFAVNFWAWALLSPLGPRYKELLGLSGSQQALIVAVPVIVGALGRIPVGALTDKFGGRVMFPLVSVSTIVPVLFIGLAGQKSMATLLIGGFFLGIGGTVFAVGIPFVSGWFPPERRGLALGLFGVGMGGTAISALTTVKLVKAQGASAPFLITAGVLAVYAAVAWLVMRDAPGRSVPTEPLGARLAATSRLSITWQACILYAVAFGGYVAFSVYLPAYLRTAYGLEQADAANRMAGFVLVAVVMRPAGGWLSDRTTVMVKHGRRPRRRQRRDLCPRRQGGTGQQGRVGDRAGWRCRWPGRVRPTSGDGVHLRQDRLVRPGPGAPGRGGCRDHGLHHDRRPVRRRPSRC
jgi:NNP family nitrate/nitrite transporter-like MFS transporter